jgi:8-oxo-dGTP diphosphatase
MSTPASPSAFKFAVLAADIALFTLKDGELLVRTVHVARPPHFPNNRALPGGVLQPTETAEEAVRRIITTKAELTSPVHVEQLYTFSDVGRDPRGRVVAVAYLGFIPWDELTPTEQEDSAAATWTPLMNARGLAYDHDAMLKMARERLAARVTYTTIIGKLMPREFTLTALEKAYATIIGKPLDKRNFRKKLLKLKLVKPVPGKKVRGNFRPAQLYRFSSTQVQIIEVL